MTYPSETSAPISLSTKRSKYRWIVVSIVFFTFAVSFADRANIGVVLPMIKKEFDLTNFQAGAMASFFFLGYIMTQLPSGFWFSRFGTRGLVSVAVIGFSIFTFLIGTVTSSIQILCYRFGLGVAEGPSPIGCTSVIQNWFPPREKATATGIYFAATQLAPVVVVPLCVWIILQFGWRYVFYFFSIPGFVVAILWYILVRNKPEECPYCSPAEVKYIQDSTPAQQADNQKIHKIKWLDKLIKVKNIQKIETNADVLKSWNIWGCAVAYLLMVCVVYGLMTWVPSYLVNEKHYSYIRMGFMGALPWMGGASGAIIGGWLSDKVFYKRRKPLMLFTTLANVAMMVWLMNAPGNMLILGAILFLTGFLFYLGYPLFTSYPMGLTTGSTFPVAYGIISTVGNVGGFFSPMIAGALLDAYSYGAVFAFFGSCTAISFLFVLMLDEPVQEV